MKVLVIGGTRFLGPYVVEELLGRGHEVAVFHRGERERSFGSAVEHVHGRVEDVDSLTAAREAVRPEAVVDMIHAGPETVRPVVEAFAGRVTRTVHVSTAAVYDSAAPYPIAETAPLAKAESAPPELAARIAADELVLAAAKTHRLPAVLLRLATPYGPRDPWSREWYFVRRALEGRREIALPYGGWPILHRGFAQSLAWGIAQAVEARLAAGAVFNLGDEHVVSVRELADMVAEAMDHRWEIVPVPGEALVHPFLRPRHFLLDLHRAKARLHYRDRMKLRDALEITVAWLCQHSPREDWAYPGGEEMFDYAREEAVIARARKGGGT
jgi:nucleoside-diphosphate-sugar epimerase